MPSATDIITRIRADSSQFKSELSSAEASTKSFGDSQSKMAEVGKVAFLGLAAGMLGVAAVSIKFAMDFEQAHTRVAVALKQAGTSMAEQGGAVDALDSKMRNLGFTDTETETGFAHLVTATRNVGESTKDMSLAADIARARNIDLVTATDMLVKVEGGHYLALSKTLGVSKDVIAGFHSQADALDYLTSRFGGSAQAATDTLAVKMQILGAQAEHVAVQIGQLLIPVLEGLMSTVVSVASFFENNTTAAIALAAVIGGPLVVAMGVWIAQMVTAAAIGIVDFITGMAAGLSDLIGIVTGSAAAWEADIVAMDAANGVMLEGAAAAETEGASMVAALGPVAIAIAAVVAVGYGLHELFGGQAVDFNAAADAGKLWGQTLVQAAQSTSDPLKTMKTDLVVLNSEFDTQIKNLEANGGSIQQVVAAVNRHKDATAQLTDEIKKETDAQKAALKTTTDTAQAMGVTIPDSYDKATQGSKTFQKALVDIGASFSTTAQQAILNIGMTTDQMVALSKSADDGAKAIEGSMSSIQNAFITHDFSKPVVAAAAVSTQAMIDFFTQSQADAVRFGGEIKTLMDTGVAPSIVAGFAKAGIGSEQNLIAFTAAVQQNGSQWVADTRKAADDMTAALVAQYRQQTADFAVATAERKVLNDALVQQMEDGNSQGFLNMQSSTDAFLKQQGDDWATGLAWIQAAHAAAMGAISGDTQTTAEKVGNFIKAQADRSVADEQGMAAAIQAAIDGIHGKEIQIITDQVTNWINNGNPPNTNIPAGVASPAYLQAHATTGNAALDAYLGSLAHGGVITAAAAGQVLRGPQLILAGEAGMEAVLPLTRFGDMVSTIKNTGMANQIAAAAVAAGGGSRGGSSSSSGGGGTDTVVVQLVVDKKVLAEVAHTGLLQKQRQSGSLGFR